MKKKIFLKVLIIVVLVMMTMLMSLKFLNNINAQISVYVAKESIDAHVLITDDMVESVKIGFEEKVQFFNKSYENKEDIVGNISLHVIKKGEVFQNNGMLLSESEMGEVINENGQVDSNYFLDENERIGFITIEKNHALGGELKKGDLIDIIFTSDNNDTGGLYASLLLQRVSVFRVSENNQSENILDIHLELNPEDALILSLAKYNGQLDLLLTNLVTEESDVLPVIPPVLYEQLINAGYLLVDESNENVEEHQESQSGETQNEETSVSDLEEQIKKAEKDLESAFAAMSAAKAALEAEKNKAVEEEVVSESIEEMIKRLELAVKDLEGAVSQNKTILEDLEVEFKNQ